MKFLIDESVEYPLVSHLRNLGFNALSVAEDFPSLEDEEILKIANKEKRIIITNDKDFGELIFYQKKKHRGVILFRLKEEDVSSKIFRIDEILKHVASGGSTEYNKDIFFRTNEAWKKLKNSSFSGVSNLYNFIPLYITAFRLSPSTFLEYVRSRKEYTTITDPSQINHHGIYVLSGDLDLNSVPAPFNSYNVALLVPGNVNVNNNFAPSQSIAIVASSTIRFASATTEANGIFIGQNVTVDARTPADSNGLKVKGNLISSSQIVNNRVLNDNSKPSLFVVFDPSPYINLLPYLSTSAYEWIDMTP